MELTVDQKNAIEKINKMGHAEMCSLWRFAPMGKLMKTKAFKKWDKCQNENSKTKTQNT